MRVYRLRLVLFMIVSITPFSSAIPLLTCAINRVGIDHGIPVCLCSDNPSAFGIVDLSFGFRQV